MSQIKEYSKQVEANVQTVLAEANAFTIETDEHYENFGKFYLRIRDAKDKVESTFGIIKKKTYEAYKEAQTQYKSFTDPLVDAEKVVNQKMFQYRQKKEHERLAEQAIEEAKQKKADEEKRLKLAEQAEEMGESELADEILEQEAPAPVVEIEDTTPKVQGITTRKTWKFKIIDETKIPREYLKPDEKAIGQIARAMKGKTNIPGVKVYVEETQSRARNG